jgi:hypothetical protein
MAWVAEGNYSTHHAKANVLIGESKCKVPRKTRLFFAKDVKKCSDVRKDIPLCKVQLPPPR